MILPQHPATTLVGVPYLAGGLEPREGFDCFTLTRFVRRCYFERETPAGAIPVEHMTSTLAAAFAIYRTLGGKERIGSPWLECPPALGCVAAMGQWKVSRLHHCGVVIDQGILHALAGCGVVWTPFTRIHDLYARVEFFECRN